VCGDHRRLDGGRDALHFVMDELPKLAKLTTVTEHS
jgi:hypothetical protein